MDDLWEVRLMPGDQPRSALDAAMNEQRIALGLKWNELAARAGVSLQTLSRIRNGETPSDLKAASLERVLGWPRGRLAQLLNQGQADDQSAGIEPRGVSAHAPPAGESIESHVLTYLEALRREVQQAREEAAQRDEAQRQELEQLRSELLALREQQQKGA